MSWLTLALGVIKLLGWLTTKLNAAEKEQAVRALVAQEELKDDLAAISAATAARKAVDTSPEHLRDHDVHERL